MESNSDVRSFSGNLADKIELLFDLTTQSATDLQVKMTLDIPGRVYTRFKIFKYDFTYLYALSSKRKEVNISLKKNIEVWLNIKAPKNNNNIIEKDFMRAGLKLFSMYGDDLQLNGIIKYKR